jgi:hypothetical protein
VVADADLFKFGADEGKETPVATAVTDKITATLKKLPEEGAHFGHIKLVEGIRAMDGEIASAGEIKILLDLDWQALPNHPTQRQALDNAAARIIKAVFSEYSDITKLRVIIKIPNSKGDYQSAAKVFSFTRPTWELIKDNTHYSPDATTGVVNLLALGDYVILTPQGWIRGY